MDQRGKCVALLSEWATALDHFEIDNKVARWGVEVGRRSLQSDSGGAREGPVESRSCRPFRVQTGVSTSRGTNYKEGHLRTPFHSIPLSHVHVPCVQCFRVSVAFRFLYDFKPNLVYCQWSAVTFSSRSHHHVLQNLRWVSLPSH